MKKGFIITTLVLVQILLTGCGAFLAPIKPKPATLGNTTSFNDKLKNLPKPKEPVVTAVYKFRDQTGQYKPSATGANWSTAVTQGATSILVRSLEESGWFLPIEREGLSNLLNERKIIRSSRANYKGASGDEMPALPPLLYAGVILEGGIIAYDTNILTGGVGAKYFGVGGSAQYREDRVTIYLRAVSTTNGRVLKTVYTSKTILSQMVDVGMYRFVEFKRLLEVETGYSYNEPPEMCVTEAIEKAVHSLIMEGIIDGLWSAEGSQEEIDNSINTYLAEKETVHEFDYAERFLDTESSASVSAYWNGLFLRSDYPDELFEIGGGVKLQYPVIDQLSVGLEYNLAKLSYENRFETDIQNIQVSANINFSPQSVFNPFLSFNVGMILYDYKDIYRNDKKNINDNVINLGIGAGAEFFVNKNIAITGSAGINFLMNDKIDNLSNGRLNDYIWETRAGLSYYPWR